ncbi:MAG: VCBS repeat-containing protein [Cryomorphaceae bacterium]|nr:VCBS repeat-containing protein [Cryomorphaceae bacterium]
MKKIVLTIVLVFSLLGVWAQSAPSTYFNIFVPPNNNAVNKDVALIVTAIEDSTNFSIIDDDMDGDDDDSHTGVLMAGQSYVLYIKDNGVNDDATFASNGILRRNGDYYTIESDKLVYASMSADSDWQHDFVPATNKSSIGQQFFVYASEVAISPRDINVFAYEPNTSVSIYRISTSSTTQTGYTNVNLENKQLVVQRTISPGEDLIYYHSDGRDLMETGGTYLVETNKDVSVQSGALWGNARDGGAYVPSANGSGVGELFYFAVPYQQSGEQEVRIASMDDSNTVELTRFENGQWKLVDSWQMDEQTTADWVGKDHGNATYPTVFRVTCDNGKRVAVMEANYMETGSHSSSDMATMVSANNGTSSGKNFMAYMLPPSVQSNVVNPFTGQTFNGPTGHFYLFAGDKNTTVTVKDAKTNGQVYSETFNIDAGRYADANYRVNQWQAVKNALPNSSGPGNSGNRRNNRGGGPLNNSNNSNCPYVIIEATENIAVLSTNFNDNWMTHFGSSLAHEFRQTGSINRTDAKPGDQVELACSLNNNVNIDDTEFEIELASGLIPVSAKLFKNGVLVDSGQVNINNRETRITFANQGAVNSGDNYTCEVKALVSASRANGSQIPHGTVMSISVNVRGKINNRVHQSRFSRGVQNNTNDVANLIFDTCTPSIMDTLSNDSWNLSWVDYDNDGWEDLFVVTKDPNAKNELYKNNGDGTFTRIYNNPIAEAKGTTVAAVWADINNNGRKDVVLVNATQHKSQLYINNGQGNFSKVNNSGLDIHPQYFHGAAFADFDNDGYVDLVITNFFSTRFHHLYRNNGNNTFTRITNTPVSTVSERAMAPILADYNNDGLVDIFIPNGDNKPNTLFKNLGNFQFEKVTEGDIVSDEKNSVGAAWGDINNDGFLDLLVVNASGQNNDLYINNGDGTFQKQTSGAIVTDGGDGHGAVFFDANNDGYLDAYVTNDQSPSFLYINDGTGNLERKNDELVSANIGKAYGIAIADYNRNGQLDMAVSTHTEGPTRLFCNNGNGNNWIGFSLQGSNSNRMAIGARVSVKAGGVWQHRQLMPVNGFGSQQTDKIHIGLGSNFNVDSVVVLWPSGIQQLVTTCQINKYNSVMEVGGRVVTGVVYHDENDNGVRDSGEAIVPNLGLAIHEGTTRFSSNNRGVFFIRTLEDFVEPQIKSNHWTGNQVSYFIGASSDTVSIEIPVTALAMGYDLSVNVATTAWRRGFTNETVLMVKNEGTQKAENVTMSITYPEHLYLVSSDSVPSYQFGRTFEWTFPELGVGEVISLSLIDSVGLDAYIGQLKILSASAMASGNDLDTTNNHVEEEIEIVGAIDPNDMLATPRGEGEEGYINRDQWVTYTIRFENVGTFEATYVFLENQLPTDMDPASFEIIASSHPYTYTLSPQGKLDVSYIHIGLPPSVEDSIGAHGYFKYRVKPKKDAAGGAILRNRANIIFDFEEPIVTNTIRHTIKHKGSNEVKNLTVYPNPTVGDVTVTLDRKYFSVSDPVKMDRWQVVTADGRTVFEGDANRNPTLDLNLARLKPGLYIIMVIDMNGDLHTGRVVKK